MTYQVAIDRIDCENKKFNVMYGDRERECSQ